MPVYDLASLRLGQAGVTAELPQFARKRAHAVAKGDAVAGRRAIEALHGFATAPTGRTCRSGGCASGRRTPTT